MTVLVLAFCSNVMAQELDAEQTSRYQHLISELRCLVCQNETIADSTADLAKDLKGQVRSQIIAGRSDAEIKGYLTDRYGDFVLYRPPFRASTVLLWIGPFALVLVALVFAVVFMRRSRPNVAEAAVDPEQLRKLLDQRK